MRIVLAGAQTSTALDTLLEFKAPSVLMSYYYMRNMSDRGRAVLQRAKDAGCWILVDSGAFTFKEKYRWLRLDVAGYDGRTYSEEWNPQASLDELRDKEGNPSRSQVVEVLEEYWLGYKEWFSEFWPMFDAFAELDLDMLTERETAWRWREDILGRVDAAKCLPIVTPHLYREDAAILELTERFRYVGVEAGKSDQEYSEFFAKWGTRFKEKRILTHGWAMTNYKAIVNWPFYSVDSTSWLAGAQYGVTYEYAGSFKMKSYAADWKVQAREKLKPQCDKYGLNHADLLADKSAEVNRLNASQWVEYANDMEAYTTNAYWLTDEERAAVTAKAREKSGMGSPALVRHDYRSSQAMQLRGAASMEYARFCNTCFLSQKCPAFEANATCSIANRPDLKTNKDFQDVVRMVISLQTERVQFSAFAERMQGTPNDERVTKEMMSLLNMMRLGRDIFDTRDEVEIKAKGSGLLARIFGGFGQQAPQRQSAQILDPEVPEAPAAETAEVRPAENNRD